jgi:hypothetical protein
MGMAKMVRHTADEILSMSVEELRALRPTFFKELRPLMKRQDVRDAFLEFITRYTIVQDMRDWSKLAEPGITAAVLEDNDWTEEDMEEARELDRDSLEMHSTIVEEFEKRGGREAFQLAIDQLNALL